MTTKELSEAAVLELVKKVYKEKLSLIEADVKLKITGKPDSEALLVSPGLKVKHKGSGILYTVDAVSTVEVELLTPEGKPFIVDAGSFTKEYEL